jgi:hypothetical protein
MRAFIIAVCVGSILAICAAIVLNSVLQENSSKAFSTTAVRLD